MNVRVYLSILVVTCLLGGYTIEYVLGEQHSSLERYTARHNDSVLVAKDFEFLKKNTAQLLVSTDLVIGSNETYLASGALNQAKLLQSQFESLMGSNSIFGEHRSARDISMQVGEIQSILEQALSANGPNREDTIAALMDTYYESSESLVFNLDKANGYVERRLVDLTQELTVARSRARNISRITTAIFSLVVFGLWVWANRQISRPLGALSAMADRAESGERFAGVERAPKEVLALSRKFTSLTKILAHQAAHDSLTDLYNRREFERQLKRTLERNCGSTARSPGTACYIDLDHFKIINDTCGHAAGDELLTQVARIFVGNSRDSDIVARLGGDEFGILFRRCSADNALQIANRIRKDIEDIRYQWGEDVFSISASIGLCEIPSGEDELATVVNAVDAACSAAKNGGRNRVHVLRADDDGVAKMRSEMLFVNQIGNAIEDSQFELHYQNIVPLDGNADSGDRYEVLLRMIDQSGEIIMPDHFLPAVERYHMGARIDGWVLTTIVNRLISDSVALKRLHSCSINLSGQSLSDSDFLPLVIEILDASGFPGEKLCFEITETSAISDLTNARAFITALKKRGIRFSLDDFGSGHSSFGYLRTLPVDYIKIDGSFVREMVSDELALATVKSITEVAKAAGKQVVAEYVETKEIEQALRDLDVDFGQGYFYGRPQLLARAADVKRLESNAA